MNGEQSKVMKSLSLTHRLPKLVLPLLLSLATSAAMAKTVEEIPTLSAGKPVLLGTMLGPKSYVKVETQKLTKARVAWVNWDYLRKSGFEVGEEKITPEIERALLDAFGWGVRAQDEPEEAFSKKEKKTFYADRYGGDGLAGNMGSGRAASAGEIQIKGIGKTELVTVTGSHHSNGTADMGEALREAIYGEVGQVLPFGANRVIAVLDRGTRTTMEDGRIQTNALIVREDPLRSAHYMKNLWGRGPLMDSEDARTKEVLKFIDKAMPVPESLRNASPAEQMRGSIYAYADRIAAQYAAAYALKIYHGATSVSNIEITGRFIDYGTITTVPDYGKFKILSINDAVGETNEFRDILMLEFLRNLRDHLPKNKAAGLPTDQELGDYFLKQYRSFHHREFLRLTGLPLSEVIKIESKQATWSLTDLMERVATEGRKSVQDPQNTTRLTKYNLNRIMVKLASARTLNEGALNLAIVSDLENKDLRHRLVKDYAKVLGSASFNQEALIAEAQNRNAERSEAYRWELYKSTHQMILDYPKHNDPKKLGAEVDAVINQFRAPKRTIRSCIGVF